jgi:hypothetical protein
MERLLDDEEIAPEPFVAFDEWLSEADELSYADL